MYVHQFKQEVATTWKTGSSYITYISGSVNGPSAVAPKSGVCWYQIPSICSIQSRKMIGDMHICTYTLWRGQQPGGGAAQAGQQGRGGL